MGRLTEAEALAFQSCLDSGGIAVFPTDTVYGIACDPQCEAAFHRLCALKDREVSQPAAIMFFELSRALSVLDDPGPGTRAALKRLLPGPVTVILPNRSRRFPLACGSSPEKLGVRVPCLGSKLEALGELEPPVLQSSANRSGAPDAATLDDLPAKIREGADLVLAAGRLPGTSSTVVDLTEYEAKGRYRLLREGALPRLELELAL